MHLVTWNVAGWRTTFAKIVEYHGSLDSFMKALQIDVLCLQEVKLGEVQFVDDKEKFGAKMPHYDAFVALSAKKGGGENGVAVFARKGLARTASKVLGGDHDASGRFIEVDLGPLGVLFNVYVHNDGEGAKNVPKKMDFLLRLRARMRSVRASGRGVILVGDFNLKRRLQDSVWACRDVNIGVLAASQFVEGEPPLVTKLRDSLQGDGLQKLRTALAEVRAVKRVVRFEHHIRNPKGDYVPLQMERTQFDQTEYFKLRMWTADVLEQTLPLIDDNLRAHAMVNGKWLISRELCMGIPEFVSAVAIVFGWPQIPSPEEIESISLYGNWMSLGKVCSGAWIRSLVEEDGMVDSLTVFHDASPDRFTIWEQYTNKRYENSGTRLDYLMFDKSLASKLLKGPVGLFACDCSGDCCTSKRCAANAATCFGRWKPAPLEGGGLPDAPKEVRNSMFRAPHTGIIYTPPDYSDHVACSALVDFPAPALTTETLASSTDLRTRACQPHVAQKSIKDMFAKRTSSTNDLKVAPSEATKGSNTNGSLNGNANGNDNGAVAESANKQSKKEPGKGTVAAFFANSNNSNGGNVSQSLATEPATKVPKKEPSKGSIASFFSKK